MWIFTCSWILVLIKIKFYGLLLRLKWRDRQLIIVFLMILSDDCASCPYEEDADYDREC